VLKVFQCRGSGCMCIQCCAEHWISCSILLVTISVQDRQFTYKRNIEARWSNCCWQGKALNITYSQRVFVALGIQHSMQMRYIVICGVPCCTLFFYIISYTAQFSKSATKNVCLDFLYSVCLNASNSEKNEARYYHKCILVFVWSASYSYNETWIFWTYFRKMLFD
jgi:hypothetical protein